MTYLTDAERPFVHEQVVCPLEEIGVGFNAPAAFELPAARVRWRESV